MKLPDTFKCPGILNPYYGLRYGIHMHWDKEQHWDICRLDYDDCSFICCRYHETYLFQNNSLLKIYITTYLKDFLKDYE